MDIRVKDLLAKKRKLQQDIKHIDACLTMFCNYAVVSEYDLLERIFSNFQDAYDYVANNNRQLDRSHDKWHRSRLYFLAYEWNDTDENGDPVRVHPEIWKNHHEFGWRLIDGINPFDYDIYCPCGDDDYHQTDEDLYGSFPE